MRKHSTIVAIAALALGLGLIAPQAWANKFKLTNSAGATIKYGCSGQIMGLTASNGSSPSFSCSVSSYNMALVGSTSTHSVTHTCANNQRHVTTASAGSTTGTLSLSTGSCEAN